MAKNYNPADAFRKAQRAKELKKNKETRKKVREVQTVKRDTRDLEGELRSLQGKCDNASKSRIAELEAELAYIIKTKEAYVKEHPEAKDKVFKPRGTGGGARQGEEEDDEAGPSGSGSGVNGRGPEHLYDPSTGRLKDPTRSAYYDPVYNPWGAPPPGMPYKDREGLTLLGGDDDDSDEEGDESDGEIVMPEGPPPAEDGAGGDSNEDSDDDIPLPPGPPPPKAAAPTPPAGPSGWGGRAPPVPIPFHHPPPPMGMSYPPFQQQQQPFLPPPQPMAAQPMRHRPERRQQVVQDPLDDEPTQTYQGYHASLPARPEPPTAPTTISAQPTRATPTPAAAASAEITAAPVLRDLRKEATVFVPRNLKRKAPAGGAAVGGRINAAPGRGVVDEEGDEVVVRKMDSGLMGKLKGVLGPDVGSGTAVGGKKGVKGDADEDYERFLAGLGDLS